MLKGVANFFKLASSSSFHISKIMFVTLSISFQPFSLKIVANSDLMIYYHTRIVAALNFSDQLCRLMIEDYVPCDR